MAARRAHVFAQPDAAFVKHFREQGFAVLEKALGAKKQQQFIDEFWSSMEYINPRCKRDRTATWHFPPGFKGIQTGYGLGQSTCAWIPRLSARVQEAFAVLFEVPRSELVTSLDAVILSNNIPKPLPLPWLHKDQATSEKRLSVQGIYSALAVGHRNAGTVLVPRSHTKALKREPKSLQVQVGTHELRAFAGHAIKPYVPAGGLLVFNSKLVHANDPGRELRAESDSAGSAVPNRLAVALAFCPRERRSEATRKQKEKAYFNGSTSNHWPCDRFSLKSINPSSHIAACQRLPEPIRDQKRLKLL